MSGLGDSLNIASAGMSVQSERLRAVAENIANAGSTASTPGADPYRRKLVMFQNVLDKELGYKTVQITKRTTDASAFRLKYDPSNPAANDQGYVQYPNVDTIVEMMDMREARRGYEANLDVIQVSKAMLSQTIGLLAK